jgi:hypothetical protein
MPARENERPCCRRNTRTARGWVLGALFLMAASLTAPNATAQDTAEPPAEQERVSFRLPIAVYASSAAADLYTTHVALERGVFYERNPMGAWLDDRPTALVAFSATADAAVVWSLHRWLAPRHPRLLRAGLYAAAGVRFWLAARNAAAVRAYDRQTAGR